jgi:hypothetical protein
LKTLLEKFSIIELISRYFLNAYLYKLFP